MNLLFLDSIEAETFGGMEEWIRLVAVGLRVRGHCPLVVGRKDSEFLRRICRCGIETHEMRISGDFDPTTIASLRSIIVQRKVDLVCVNFNKDVRLGGLAAKWAGSVPVVWSVGLDIAGDSWVHRALTPRLISGVVVPSNSLKVQLLAHGYLPHEGIEVIPIGIEDIPATSDRGGARTRIRQQFSLPSVSLVAVTVGRFVEQKGHSYLIDAIPQMIGSHPKMRYLLVGDGALRVVLESQARDLGVSEQVVFGGMRDDVAAILAGCDLMIHPSVEEPFGIAILEGMRAGLPVVASRVGGIPEVLGDSSGGVLVESRNPNAIATAVNDLFDRRGEFGESGRVNRLRFESLFTADKMTDRLERYFDRIVNQAVARG